MVGTATLIGHEDGRYDYREQGRLTLTNGQSLDAERRYFFREENDGFAVFFAETPPSLFHRVALRREGATLIGTATHLCEADRYDSRYEFFADGDFSVQHRVEGPRKRYSMITRYARELR
jgi:hypothetical protein